MGDFRKLFYSGALTRVFFLNIRRGRLKHGSYDSRVGALSHKGGM